MQRNLPVIVEDEDAIAQRMVHGDFQIGIGAFDGAKIAAGILHRWQERRSRQESGR